MVGVKMLNMLVVEDNYNYIENLINKILQNNENVRLCKMCTNGKDALESLECRENNIDIVLLDLKLPSCNGIEILKIIQEKKLLKEEKSVIVISGEMNNFPKVISNPYVYTYLDKILGFNKIIEKINALIQIKEESIGPKQKITEELIKLGYNFSYVGTRYMLETILIIYNMNSDFILEKNIYAIIGKKYNKSINNIKTNIINATEAMYFDSKQSDLNDYFGYSLMSKPRPKEIIYTILNKIMY